MRWPCTAALALLCALDARSAPVPADDILAFVRARLPSEPLRLAGSLRVRTPSGFTQAGLPVEMELDWGAATPRAKYRVGGETLDIAWRDGRPHYVFSDPAHTPASGIAGTGLTWADLGFSFLWWPGSTLAREERKINRDCFVVDVPVPDSPQTMRLWIEKHMGMLLEAQTLDPGGKEVRRMKIQSIKKMDGMWIAKDLELLDRAGGNKTLLRISDLEWLEPPEVAAFDPAEAANRLASSLYQALAEGNDDNLFFSPYSIAAALAMAYGGARGETAAQMEAALHFGGQGATHPAFAALRAGMDAIRERGHVQLNAANSLWPQWDHPFLPDYLAMASEFYAGETNPVDFKADTEGARRRINEWVEERTRGLIKELVPAGMLDPLSRLVLANAIYFKGSWASQFNPEQTRPAPFTRIDGTRTEVPMMSQTGRFGLARAEGFRALELPYEGGDLSMLVLLPDDPAGLPGLERNLLAGDGLDGLRFHGMETIVQIPRFKLESSFSLGGVLAAMGMPLAFSAQADFSGMDGSRNLFIGAVVHKAFVEVNEEGTEAAAATAVGIRATSLPPEFTADRPFLFLIRDNASGTTLFAGRVMDPS